MTALMDDDDFQPPVGFLEDEAGPDIFNEDGTFSTEKAKRIFELTKDWPPEQQSAALSWVEAAVRREKIRTRYANAAEIAHAADPDFVITPALALIADAIETVLASPRCNLLVTMPPQEGKSTLCAVWAPIRAWQLNPNTKVIVSSYGDDLAHTHSANCRSMIEQYGSGVVDPMTGIAIEDRLGLKLSKKSRRVDAWKIDGANGGMVAAGIGSAITGKPADLFVIDDPFKNMQEADSATHREKVDLWMGSVVQTRLSPQASIILIQCMTGDTPVLMADGAETPLRDIRPGDQIATYENGALSRSNVVNWASQGYDSVYTIITESGRSVRANARHPFLIVDEDGTESWARLSELRPGIRLRAAPGSAWPALSMDAIRLQRARECVVSTTGARDGRPATVLLLATRRETEGVTSSTATVSLPTTSKGSLRSRAAAALFAVTRLAQTTTRLIGRACASTIATRPAGSVGCSATTAISWSAAEDRLNDYVTVPTTLTDTIVSIEPCGTAEVFDIQVERTENFIANGLVSHNTRWHPEDLAGKVLAAERQLPKKHRRWRYLNIPAISEAKIPDSLGRKPNTVMISARGRDREEFEATRRTVGERVWYAMYQGNPTNPAGGLFERDWFEPRVIDPPSQYVAAVVGVDPADSGEGDETGIVGGVLAGDGSIIFTEDRSGQLTSDKWGRKAVELALEMGAKWITMEGFVTWNTYRNVVVNAWKELHQEAREKLATGQKMTLAQERALFPTMPFMVGKWTAGGDPVGRAATLRQAFEIRKARVVEFKLNVFVEQAADWQAGQHCPDRVSAAVIAYDELAKIGAGRMQAASPLHHQQRQLPSWLTRSVFDGNGGDPRFGQGFGGGEAGWQPGGFDPRGI